MPILKSAPITSEAPEGNLNQKPQPLTGSEFSLYFNYDFITSVCEAECSILERPGQFEISDRAFLLLRIMKDIEFSAMEATDGNYENGLILIVFVGYTVGY